jgi:hypothetical protein
MSTFALKTAVTTREIYVLNSMVLIFIIIDTYIRKRSEWSQKSFCEEMGLELKFASREENRIF